jgi:hypothetical protein
MQARPVLANRLAVHGLSQLAIFRPISLGFPLPKFPESLLNLAQGDPLCLGPCVSWRPAFLRGSLS